ncbi:hypothetical protein, partial [Pseudoalteromonas ruthenica]|uniref:hypothetical protein n=1 Tax=Pseudoalteromonas ruthenica TaxID=151081 RepID=UPI001BB2A04F
MITMLMVAEPLMELHWYTMMLLSLSTQAHSGGPLGYGYTPGVPGFAGGWLGMGWDEYGNFSNEGGQGAIGRR